MSVSTETWGREACELIDYDSENLHKSSYEINDNGYIYRSANEIMISKDELIENNFEKLLKIKKNENNYEIIRNTYLKDEKENITSKNSAWFLLKKSKMNDKLSKYKIHQGEIIKIGRITTRIKEIRFDKNTNKSNHNNTINNSKINNNSINSKNNHLLLKDIDDDILIQKKDLKLDFKKQFYEKIVDMANQRSATDANMKDKIQILSINNVIQNKANIPNDNSNNKFNTINNNTLATENTLSVHTENKKKKKVCRICYTEEEDGMENPIVQPCHCLGSCKYIHLNCLKQWINTKSCLKIDQNDYCSVFIFTETECEICKAKLPDLVEHNGNLYSLLDFSDEFLNYLILESITLDKENNKFLYVISLDKKEDIKVGRGQFCDIILSDVSVSRIHSLITVEGKNIYIRDNNSKFGTLILMQAEKLKMTEDLPLHIQVGRTYFNFVLKSPKVFGCCGVSENPNILYYFRQNEKVINNVFTVKTEENKNYDNNSDSDDEEKKVDEDKIEEKKINENKNEKKEKNEIEEIINV